MRRPKITTQAILVTIFFGCAFFLGTWTVIRANGYRLLVAPIRLVKTGLISLRVHPDEQVDIYLNGELQPQHQFDFNDLAPGRYSIKVTRAGYQNWERTVTVVAGQAIVDHDVTLYYQQPEVDQVSDPTELQQDRNLLADVGRFQWQLQTLGDEVWVRDQMLTRYSAPITQALWSPDETHVLILVNNQLHSVELTRGTDTILFDVPTTAKTVAYVPIAGGQKILVQIDDNVFVYTVTDPYSIIPLPSF